MAAPATTPVPLARRRFALRIVALFAVTSSLLASAAIADEVAVPPALQAQLVAKVAAYDRDFATRAGPRALVLIVRKPGDNESVRTAAALLKALAELPDIAGLPHEESVVPWVDAPSLAATIRERHAAIVYLTPGFSSDIDAIRGALDGVDVLSVSAVADDVPRGVVLGFDLVSSKPKLLVHLGQARKQHVAFKAEVLKLMKVYE